MRRLLGPDNSRDFVTRAVVRFEVKEKGELDRTRTAGVPVVEDTLRIKFARTTQRSNLTGRSMRSMMKHLKTSVGSGNRPKGGQGGRC